MCNNCAWFVLQSGKKGEFFRLPQEEAERHSRPGLGQAQEVPTDDGVDGVNYNNVDTGNDNRDREVDDDANDAAALPLLRLSDARHHRQQVNKSE